MSRRVALAAAPGLLLAAAGLFHPVHLTYATSLRWTLLHVVGLFVFPLLGLALVSVVAGRRGPLVRTVVVASYVYATAYSALDIVAGITAGYVTHRLGPGVPRPDEVRYVFDIGNVLGGVGVLGMLAATVALAAEACLVAGRRAVVPGLVLVVAAVSFLDSHIYPWRGVLTVAVLGLATGWLAAVVPERHRV